MTQLLKKAIDALSSLDNLSEEEQRNLAAEILELVESAKTHHIKAGAEKVGDDRPIWEVIDELGQGIPEEELERLPEDGAAEHDHYIYGTPKRYS